jgi:hypothetical protein
MTVYSCRLRKLNCAGGFLLSQAIILVAVGQLVIVGVALLLSVWRAKA